MARKSSKNGFDYNSGAAGSSPAGLSRSHSAQHYAEQRKTRGRKKVLKITLITLLVVVLGGIGAAWAYINSVSTQLSSGIDDTLRDTLTTTTGGDPFYMLLMGVDKSEERSESEEYGASDSAYRSDSIMLARIDPDDKQVTLVSLHRDTLIDMGTNGKQKLNAAYSIGGPSYCVTTVAKLSGVNISHYAEIDFDNFCKVVDQIGGIEVDVPMDINDEEYTGTLKKGLQTLNGDQALILCRSRHAYDDYGDGDLYRAANQRLVIKAIVQKILELDPVSMASTISTLASSVTTDMDLGSIVSLANSMRGIDVNNDIFSGMEPTTSEYVNDTWYELLDTSGWKTMMQRVDAGLSPYASTSEDPTGNLAGSPEGVKNTNGESKGTVSVLNGTSTTGVAATLATKLGEKGYTASADNADSQDYTNTLVIYGDSSQLEEANAVAAAIGGNPTVQVTDGSHNFSTDVLVIVGTDLVSSLSTTSTTN